MSPKQKKLAAKAPPPNKLDEKDFAVLREEKAKGRGMGLQDVSKKPGKIYKAKRGMSFSDKMKAVEDGKINKKTGKPTSMAAMREMKGFKPGENAQDFMKRRKQLSGAGKVISATKIGKMLLPVVGAGVAAQQYLKSKMKKKNKNKEPEKKMGGGMMQRPMGYKGGGMDTGRVGEMKSRIAVAVDRIKKAKKSMGIGSGPIGGGRLTDSDKEKIKSLIGKNKAARPIKRNMGGMMMQRPMGYKIGTGKKPLETAMNKKRAEQTKNVKRLTTESDAYNPERRILHASKKTRSGSTNE